MLTKNCKFVVPLCALALSLTAMPAQAALVQADIGLAGSATQSGWTAWHFTDGFDTDVHSMGFSLGADAFTASLTAAGASIADGTGGATAAIANSGGGALDDLLTGAWFARRDTVFTLSGLDAGTYNLTTYHRGQAGPILYTLADSVAPDESGSLTQIDGSDATGDVGIGTFTFVSDGSDVILTLDANQIVTGNNHNAYLNGFELANAAIPEPSTLILLSTGLLGLLACGRRRNRRRRA